MERLIRMILILLTSGICFVPAQAGDFTYPVLQSHGSTLKSFLPAGWHMLSTATGDLNGDHLPDIAAVMESKTDLSADSKEDNPPRHHCPRIFFILFGQKAGGYKLSVQSNDLIPFADDGRNEDPFVEGGSLAITHGTVMLGVSNSGSNYREFDFSQFRFQQNGWYLIGLTEDYWELNEKGTASEYDYNLSTGKMKISTGVLNDGRKKMFMDVKHVRWTTPGKRKVRLAQYQSWYESEWGEIPKR